ncbi:putative mitochondrial protein [Cucumis melo var. makuwa]|uniref:Putative mitochondrial protein n=1 Tax=Cucumis melo var. makuwa TaxID=1194695 RepID=A0A5D3CKE0_CUCMM|nr:putative mitochondrial protein [Cucumis melo var. makuwa]
MLFSARRPRSPMMKSLSSAFRLAPSMKPIQLLSRSPWGPFVLQSVPPAPACSAQIGSSISARFCSPFGQPPFGLHFPQNLCLCFDYSISDLFLISLRLRPEYESIRAALLHRSLLPSLDAAIQEILFEEKRLGINLSKHSDVVLAGTYSPSGASITFCKNCKLTGHKFIDCPKIECKYCHKPGHILDNCPIKPPRPRSYSTRAKNFTKPVNSSSSSALAVSPGNQWLLGSAYCNHMTSNYSLMNTPSSAKSLSPIYAADDNCMNITHVQDPQVGQTIRTGHKVGRLFELLSLQVPPPSSSISAPVTDSDTYQWHLRLAFALTMLWSIKTLLFYLLSPNRALLFSASAPTLLNKMGVLNANIATFLTQYVPSFFLPHALRNFEVKQLLHPSILSIVFLPLFFKISLHSKDYMVLFPTILTLKSLVMLALFSCILMNTLNLNHVPASVVFLAMAQNIKHTMFSHLSSFHSSFSSPQPFFTDTSVDLFPLSESTPDNELAQSAPTSATSNQLSVSVASPEPTPDTLPRRSTRVREPPIHLQDYHYFSTIVFLVEPTSYQEASTDPLWQKAMNDELQLLKRRTLGTMLTYLLVKDLLAASGCTKSRLTLMFISCCCCQAVPLLQMDAKNTFLNEALSKEVYMKPPPSTFPPLHKVISDLQHYLGQHFEMKDFGSLNCFLGLEVSRRSDEYLLSQAKYAYNLLARSGITDSNIASTPLDPNLHLIPYDGVPLKDVSLCRQLVGSLIYLIVTRPDIAYVVHIVSQFMAAPRTIHFTAVLHILHYIKGTLGHELQFSSQYSLVLSGYFDADWAGDPTYHNSTESEYRALADATTELLWLCWLLADMGVPTILNGECVGNFLIG